MRTLSRVGFRNERPFVKIDGSVFRGVIFPASDLQTQSTTILTPRHLLRTRVNEPVEIRDVFRDRERMFLVADHDGRLQAKTFTLFEMTHHVMWRRQGPATLHPTTRQPIKGAMVDQGLIWCLIENQRASQDAGLNVQVGRERIITHAPIQVGDVVNDQVVKELVTVLGVQVGEIE